MLFTHDVALIAHSGGQLQQLMDNFSKACEEFSLTISLKKSSMMDQGVEQPLGIKINIYNLGKLFLLCKLLLIHLLNLKKYIILFTDQSETWSHALINFEIRVSGAC